MADETLLETLKKVVEPMNNFQRAAFRRELQKALPEAIKKAAEAATKNPNPKKPEET